MTTITARTPCPLCGTHAGAVLSRRDGKSGERLTVLQCEGCGLGRIDPLPTAGELTRWYAAHYRQEYKAAATPRMTHVLRAGRMAAERWAWARAVHPDLSPATSLDIGASSGEFVYMMRKFGVDARGIEPHEGYSGYARQALGVDVVTGALQDRVGELTDGGFDLITMFHVLEHLTDPVGTLRELRRFLTPDGTIFIEVPDVTRLTSPGNTFFRAHTLYFSPHAMAQLARASDLEVVADDPRDGGNIRMLLRAARTGQPERAKRFVYDDALARAQRRRTWARYLTHRLLSGHLVKRLRGRREEERFASRFGDGRALLDSLFAWTANAPAAGPASKAGARDRRVSSDSGVQPAR